MGASVVAGTSVVIGGSVVLTALLIVLFPGIVRVPISKITHAFTDKGVDKGELYLQKRITEAKKKNYFDPPKTPEYKTSYVDNVLYTTDFDVKSISNISC